MSVSRPLIALLGVGFVGVAAIGAGAGATFTTSTTSAQTITAGTIDMSLSAANVPGCTSAADHCHALTLPAVGPVGSTFESPATEVTMTNTGNIPTTFSSIQMTATHGSSASSAVLLNEMNVCIQGKDASGGPWVEGNGPLTTALNLHPSVVENPVKLAPGESATYWVNFYAGQDSLCGGISSSGSHTAAAWEGVSGSYTTPASLTNDAMGGSVTPTLTWSFTG